MEPEACRLRSRCTNEKCESLDGTVEFNKSTQLSDGAGHWNLSEVRQGTVKPEAVQVVQRKRTFCGRMRMGNSRWWSGLSANRQEDPMRAMRRNVFDERAGAGGE